MRGAGLTISPHEKIGSSTDSVTIIHRTIETRKEPTTLVDPIGEATIVAETTIVAGKLAATEAEANTTARAKQIKAIRKIGCSPSSSDAITTATEITSGEMRTANHDRWRHQNSKIETNVRQGDLSE